MLFAQMPKEKVISLEDYERILAEITTLKARVSDVEFTQEALRNKVLRKIQLKDEPTEPKKTLSVGKPTR